MKLKPKLDALLCLPTLKVKTLRKWTSNHVAMDVSMATQHIVKMRARVIRSGQAPNHAAGNVQPSVFGGAAERILPA